MDFSGIEENLPLIFIIIALILLPFFLGRKRRAAAMPQEIARNLLSEVRLNLSLAEVYSVNGRVKRFETVSWQLSKSKLDFLDRSLRAALTDAFAIAEDYNQQVDAAKKYRSGSQMANINIDKLKGSLTKSKEGLEQWLMSKVGTKEPPPQYPGIMDSLFGGRG